MNSKTKKLQHFAICEDSEIDYGLLSHLLTITNAPDTALPHDLIRGMPLSGTVKMAGSLRQKTADTPVSIETLTDGLRKNNEKILRNLKRQSVEDRRLAFDMTLKEIENGMIGPLRPVLENDMNDCVMTPRFIVHQDKPRLIDNLKTSRVNETASAEDTYIPDSLDRLICQIRAVKIELQKHSRQSDVKAFSYDFKSAYKHIAIEEHSLNLANIIILEPDTLRPLTGRMLCQPFGSTLSPRNWGRVVEAIKYLNRKLFHIATFCFVDDVFGCEPSDTAHSAHSTSIEFARLLGFKVHKIVEPTETLTLLGAELSIRSTEVILRNPIERINKIETEIIAILKANRLSPALASSLRGKLGFAQSLLFGRIGRCHVHGLIKRQYSKTSSNTLDTQLKSDLTWWLRNLRKTPERYVPTCHEQNHVVYSDASKELFSGIGTIIATKNSSPPWHESRITPPDWLKNEDIFTLELLAATIAFWQLSTLTNNGLALIFVDNMSALAALIRGSTDRTLPRILVETFWTTARKSRLIPWVEYVRSCNNPADAPSRNAPSNIETIATLPVPQWISSLEQLKNYCK